LCHVERRLVGQGSRAAFGAHWSARRASMAEDRLGDVGGRLGGRPWAARGLGLDCLRNVGC
nr:hypothetical protein [Thermoanaerobaculia bacterium]